MENEVKSIAMKMLTVGTNLVHDGGDDDRLFLNDSYYINVFASDMSKENYNAMEKIINTKIIKGQGYEVYAWNDCSGHSYWSRDHNESNYIQVTVSVTNIDLVDISKMNKDAIELFNYFSGYDNSDYHDFNKTEENEEAV